MFSRFVEMANLILPKVHKTTHMRRDEFDAGDVCRVEIWKLFNSDGRKSLKLVHYVGASESSDEVCIKPFQREGNIIMQLSIIVIKAFTDFIWTNM